MSTMHDEITNLDNISNVSSDYIYMTISGNIYQHLSTFDNIYHLIYLVSEELVVQRKGNVDDNFNFLHG